jgi:hypothetical protein
MPRGPLALLLLAAVGADAAPPAGRFRPDALRLASAPPELQERVRQDPVDYFRFQNAAWAAAVCDAFRDDLPALPTAILHGDAHLEQYALTATARGLDDFDDAGHGPAVVDLVRFLGSMDLVTRGRGWTAARDRVFGRFLDGYRRALANPSYEPPEPAVVTRLRARPHRTRQEFLAWGESLMQELTPEQWRNALASLALIEGLVRQVRPEVPAGYFGLKRIGRLRMTSCSRRRSWAGSRECPACRCRSRARPSA